MHPPVHLVGEDNGQESFLVFITRNMNRTTIESSLARFMKLTEHQPPIQGGATAGSRQTPADLEFPR